jgi:hypothetical protein
MVSGISLLAVKVQVYKPSGAWAETVGARRTKLPLYRNQLLGGPLLPGLNRPQTAGPRVV